MSAEVTFVKAGPRAAGRRGDDVRRTHGSKADRPEAPVVVLRLHGAHRRHHLGRRLVRRGHDPLPLKAEGGNDGAGQWFAVLVQQRDSSVVVTIPWWPSSA